MSMISVRPGTLLPKGLSITFGLATCVLINLPSVKFLALTSALNVLVVAILATAAFLRVVLNGMAIRIGPTKKIFGSAFVLMVCLLLLSGVFGPKAALDTTEVGRVIALLVSIPIVLLFIQPNDIRVFLVGQVCWSAGIAFWHMTNGFTIRGDMGLHYLNLGLGIAGGVAAAGGMAVFARGVMVRTLAIIALLVCFAGLLRLYGRAPIFFSSFVVVLFAVASSLRRGSFGSRLLRFAVIGGVVGLAARTGIRFLAQNWYGWARIERVIYATDQEPRVQVFMRSIDLLLERPILGSGLNAAESVLGHYPHNIFLDVAISAGIPALLCLLVVIGAFARVVIAAFKGPFEVGVSAMIALYFFMTWNVSFTIGNSYVMFGAMAVAVAAFEHARANQSTIRLRNEAGVSEGISAVPIVAAGGLR